MTKAEFVKELKEKTGFATYKQAEEAFSSLLDLIASALQKDGELTITGFGRFKVVKRQARNGRNPRTGQPMQLKASKTVKFSPGKGLKEQLN